jgi:hypothetical protein
MNLKLRRLVRTPHSEQYALFDTDRTDANYDPVSVGKLDVHLTSDGVYGTFLVWSDVANELSAEALAGLTDGVVRELCEPMGVPAEYAIEFFAPDLKRYQLLTNVSETQADEDEPSG